MLHPIIDLVSTPDEYSTLQLSVSGLQGGHSGVDINKGRLNAIKVLVQALVRLNKRMTALDSCDEGIAVYDLQLSDIKRCDVDKANAIPAVAEAMVVLPQEQVDPFRRDFTAFCKALKDQSQPAESGFSYKADQVDSIAQVMDIKSTDALLCMLQQVPHGVIAMIPGVPGVVETTNLYTVAIDGSSVTIGSSNRSSHDASLIALNNVQANIGHLFQYNVATNIDSYPSWQPNASSPLLNVAKAVYGNLYGDDRYNATVIHAGLECGTISAKYGAKGISMDCVSIGPTIKKPHTPNESLQTTTADGTQTVKEFYDAVSGILQKVFDG
ncbi:MAG: aminoacyl-histidine dipeptidase [Proteobacteria bacterium]|nr:aminoacyl-histidine dipeptidase [Pseudomonadota bacterium]